MRHRTLCFYMPAASLLRKILIGLRPRWIDWGLRIDWSPWAMVHVRLAATGYRCCHINRSPRLLPAYWPAPIYLCTQAIRKRSALRHSRRLPAERPLLHVRAPVLPI